MAKRSATLEFAVLGLLHDQPMHGYELRKRLNSVLGSFRAISYGSLYPCLRDLVNQGYIAEDGPADAGAPALSGRRARIVYKLTAEGKERFAALVSEIGPDAWEDETFDVHFAFFGRTPKDVRLRILQGRRSRLEERLAALRESMGRTRERLDDYTLELQRHGLESVESEMRWLGGLIESEQAAPSAGRQSRSVSTTSSPSTTGSSSTTKPPASPSSRSSSRGSR